MFYREAGQFKTSYQADQSVFPIRQDRIGLAVILLLAFVVVIIGGLGSLKGAFVGGLVVGMLDTMGRVLFPQMALFTIFVPMAVILVVRPTGLFGVK